ncbi:unnamed protein product [Cylindrotheca closterium]|uniref:Uncharacterized protein n=1 Tax=Cylindrotheca closterium TaxID=2856 RepID=A0AAD2JGP3_9STRA|nr:unnamed protein product [Cylindrotheca closterium]
MSGYLDFQQYFTLDHRGLWIDIDLEATLGAPSANSLSFQPRCLTLADGHLVDRYIKAAEAGYRHFCLPQCLTQFAEDISVQDGYLTAKQQDGFNTIHHQAYEIRRRAERNCRKLLMGKVHRSGLVHRRFRRLLKKTGLSDAWKLLEPDLQAKWYLEPQEYKEVKLKQAHQWRLEYLGTRLAAVQEARKGNINACSRRTQVQWMAQKEETRRRWKAQGKGFSGGFQQIKVAQVAQDGSSHWVTCQSKRLVEEGCTQENRLQYDQTCYPYSTPPMTEPLYSNFNGPNAEQNSHALLRSLYEVETADPYLASFMTEYNYSWGTLKVTLEDKIINSR